MSVTEFAYKQFVRKRLFAKSAHDPEIAHEIVVSWLKRIQRNPISVDIARTLFQYPHPMLKTRVLGIDFTGPFGIAAGFDKYGDISAEALPAFGWNFIEAGGFTRFEQEGNDRVRMARSREHGALWNCMGFNNPGADIGAFNLSLTLMPEMPIGVNIGKSKVTPLEEAAEDYCYTLRKVWPYAKFITVNVTSPNTPGLRRLQDRDDLRALLLMIQEVNAELALKAHLRPRPICFKLSPDETDERLWDIVDICRETRVAALIATNTTVDRSNIAGWNIPTDRGGVSGKPLAERSMRILRELYGELKGEIPLISVGGIMDGHDLYTRILMGANLCQAYTAWVFEGPDFVKRSLKTLVRRLKADGFKNVSDAVGAGYEDRQIRNGPLRTAFA